MPRVSKDAIADEVLEYFGDNSSLIASCYKNGTTMKVLHFIAKLSKEARYEVCVVINNNNIDYDALMHVIERSSAPKLSDLNIARAIKLATLNYGKEVLDLVEEFLNLALSGNHKNAIKCLFEVTYSGQVPVYVAEILFKEYGIKNKKIHFVNYDKWQWDDETNERYKVYKKGLHSLIGDITYMVNESRFRGTSDYLIKEKIKNTNLLEFLYGKGYEYFCDF